MPFLALDEDLILNGSGAEMQAVIGREGAAAALFAGMFFRISSNGFDNQHSLTCPSVCVVLLLVAAWRVFVGRTNGSSQVLPDFRIA